MAFLNEVSTEIKKVKWPTRKEVIDDAVVVLVIVVVFTTAIALMDMLLVKFVSLL